MFGLNTFRDEPYNLQFVYAGEMFKWSYSALLNAGANNFEIITPTNKDMHIINQTVMTASTNCQYTITENGILADGVAVSPAPFNVNRLEGTTAKSNFLQSPTTSLAGTVKISQVQLVANNKWNQITPEIILPRNSKYLFTLLPKAFGPLFFISFTWYEAGN